MNLKDSRRNILSSKYESAAYEKKSTCNLSWLDEELVWVTIDVLIDQLQAEKG